MNKSDFYKKWYSEHKGYDLNAQGYPSGSAEAIDAGAGLGWLGEEIPTAEQWAAFVDNEPSLEHMKRFDKDAYVLDGGVEADYKRPHEFEREYPELTEQLDKLYKDVDAGKLGADAKTGDWYTAVKAVKDGYPKN